MLPDFIKTKAKMFEIASDAAIARAKEKHSILKSFSSSTQHEGSGIQFVDIHGEVSLKSYTRIESATETMHADLPTMSFDKWVDLLTDFYEKMFRQQVQIVFDSLHQSTEKTGNFVHLHGKGVTEDAILEVLRRIPLDFDGKDPLDGLMMVVSPDTFDQISNDVTETPEFIAARDEIIEQQRIEWRLNSIDRRLVD